MPEYFRYLVRSEKSSDAANSDVLENVYDKENIAGKFVVRDELANRYIVFESSKDFWKYSDAAEPEQRCFHEVVFGWSPQRCKFDIDAPFDKILQISAEEADALNSGGHASGLSQLSADDYDEADIAHAFDVLDEEEPDIGGGEFSQQELCAIETRINDLLKMGGDDDCARQQIVTRATTPQQRELLPAREKMHKIIEYIVDTILDELHINYVANNRVKLVATTRSEVIVTESCGNTAAGGYKFSYHIILHPYTFENNQEVKNFTSLVLSRLHPAIRQLVDPQVNKSIQNFRLLDSTKPGAGRYKRVTNEFGTAMPAERDATIITPCECLIRLPKLCSEKMFNVDGEPQLGELAEANKIIAASGLLESHQLRGIRGCTFIYDRLKPSLCELCGRIHRNDNTLMILVEPVEGAHDGAWPDDHEHTAHRIVEMCRHNPSRTRILGEIKMDAAVLAPSCKHGGGTSSGPANAPANFQYITHTLPPALNPVAQRIEAIKMGLVDPHNAMTTQFEHLSDGNKNVYCEPNMRPYELVDALYVKAQMKLGKTKMLKEYVDMHFPTGGLKNPVIRIITFRQTFSSQMKNKFPDFCLYSDIKGDLTQADHPRLIVQVESLHRLRMDAVPEPADLIVLDEVESIISQFDSGLHKRFPASFAMFQWLLRTSHFIVCMDANLSDRTLHVVQKLRPGSTPFFHWNKFSRAADDQYYFTDNRTAWVYKLTETLNTGQRVVISTNSLGEAETLQAYINAKFPELIVKLYSSKTPASEKLMHFANVDEYWSNLDVLIYTPTVSAGVSFERKHFDVLFGYFSDKSCDVETCRQMLARVRNITSHCHYICVRGSRNSLPTDIGEIRRLSQDRRAGLYREIQSPALLFEYDELGEIHRYESNYFTAWLENRRIENLSKNDFINRFIDQVADSGASVEVLDIEDADDEDVAAAATHHKEAHDAVVEEECKNIAGATELTAEEAEDIRATMQKPNADVPPLMKTSYEKFQLRNVYNWHDADIDADFVKKYSPPHVRRIYKNLQRITAGQTLKESLAMIQEIEKDTHERHMVRTAQHINNKAIGGANGAPVAPDFAAENLRNTIESKDLHYRFVYQQHSYAVWMLSICSFRCITDKRFVYVGTIERGIRDNSAKLISQFPGISMEFGIRCPKRLPYNKTGHAFVKYALYPINGILKKMYGILIRKTSSRSAKGGDYYFISHTKFGTLFKFEDPRQPPQPARMKPVVYSMLIQPEPDTIGTPEPDDVAINLDPDDVALNLDPDDVALNLDPDDVALNLDDLMNEFIVI